MSNRIVVWCIAISVGAIGSLSSCSRGPATGTPATAATGAGNPVVPGGQVIAQIGMGQLVGHMHVAEKNVQQEYYAARAGDYFLIVIISYAADDERDTLRAILESIKAG